MAKDDEITGGITERPILFSGAMVAAIREGRKTQTRRFLRGQVTHPHLFGEAVEIGFIVNCHGKGVAEWCPPGRVDCFGTPIPVWETCPYGKPGDRLWVRETVEITNDPRVSSLEDVQALHDPMEAVRLRYSADGEERELPDEAPGLVDWLAGKWKRPSIHMPRWASRILLEIVSVHVERLQSISEEDAEAEGCMAETFYSYIPGECVQEPDYEITAVQQYEKLWGTINGATDAKSWDANPWVWVVEFKRIEG